MTRQLTFNRLSAVVALLSVFLIGLLTYSQFIEQPYLTYQNLPFPSIPKAKAGQVVELSVERCSSSDVIKTYDTTHSIANQTTKEVVIMPNVMVSISPGCHRAVSKINVVPEKTAPGIYHVFGIATVQGVFRTHLISWYSEPFEVVSDDPAPHADKGQP